MRTPSLTGNWFRETTHGELADRRSCGRAWRDAVLVEAMLHAPMAAKKQADTVPDVPAQRPSDRPDAGAGPSGHGRDQFGKVVQAALDAKTKPPGALGKIEALAARIARFQNTLKPSAERCRLTLFAADHGMAEAGVSAYPQAVTRQMVLNFLAGGAAANAFAAALGAELVIVDAGVAGEPIEHPALISRRLGHGTANAVVEAAMSGECLTSALRTGRVLGAEGTHEVGCFGEMGIGNTASASLVAAKTLGIAVDELVGRGTGLDDAGLARKQRVLQAGARRTAACLGAKRALEEYGGFEIAMMTGAMLGAARTGKLVIVDGFIASVAALCALDFEPGAERAFIYAHRSTERGHQVVLDALRGEPLLDLGMRLGEGTGALLAWPLVKAAAAMLRDMASFGSAGVSGPHEG